MKDKFLEVLAVGVFVGIPALGWLIVAYAWADVLLKLNIWR